MNDDTVRAVPVELRHLPPAPTLGWVERAVGPGARVVQVRRLRNAWGSAMHEVRVEHGGTEEAFVLRRWARRDLTPDDGIVENEARALQLLERVDLETPWLVASDPDADECDAPALLMTRLRGRDVLGPAHVDAWIDDLASTMHVVHAAPDPGSELGPFFAYGDDRTKPPPWSRQPGPWERAIEIAHGPAPDAAAGFCHRDFWPGNVLWSRGKVSGVVDWTNACRGPAAVDVAHCRLNVALLFGQDAARTLAERYGPVADLAWFDVSNAVGMGNPAGALWRWHDAGRRDLTSALIIERIDTFVADAVERVDQ